MKLVGRRWKLLGSRVWDLGLKMWGFFTRLRYSSQQEPSLSWRADQVLESQQVRCRSRVGEDLETANMNCQQSLRALVLSRVRPPGGSCKCRSLSFEGCSAAGVQNMDSTWTTKVCKIMAQSPQQELKRLLFYILWGSR